MAEMSDFMDEEPAEIEEHDDEPDFLDAAAAALDDLGELGGDDLEQAYLKAMSALDATDLQFPDPPANSLSGDNEAEQHSEAKSYSAVSKEIDQTVSASGEDNSEAPSLADLFAQEEEETPAEAPAPEVEARLTPRQIIEACLFVGGFPLTSKKLASVLRGEFDGDYVDREINELNRRYAAEGRPYEIRLGDGGYRLSLREEFERIRHKVYGLGPKEVRLSQDALEVLAVVAYHQPIRQKQVEEMGKPSCGAVLRQLVRRELISVERDPEPPREVSYKTTGRFLSLFGITSLDELPRHEQVSYK